MPAWWERLRGRTPEAAELKATKELLAKEKDERAQDGEARRKLDAQRMRILHSASVRSGGKALYHLHQLHVRLREREATQRQSGPHVKDHLRAIDGAIGRRRNMLLALGYEVPADILSVMRAIRELEQAS